MSYNPRIYWPQRLKEEGPRYVGKRGMTEAEVHQQGEKFWAALSPFIPAKSDGTVLDFGCGTGRFAIKLAERYKQYIGVDIAGRAFEYAPTGPNIRYQELIYDGIDLPTKSIDAVVAVTVLQHITDDDELRRWVKEIRRISKSKGMIYIIDGMYKDFTRPHVRTRRREFYQVLFKYDLIADNSIHIDELFSHYVVAGQLVPDPHSL